MSQMDNLITIYANDLQNKCNIIPNMDLLRKITISCGPAIYNKRLSKIVETQPSDIEIVKNNFLVKRLGLSDEPELVDIIHRALESYENFEQNKYRVVIYYMLVKYFSKEDIYD